MSGDRSPVVEIILITYNQELFVEEALVSLIAQQTSFPIIITVNDDCSTDSTGEIIAQFAARHPDRIRLRPNARNLCSNLPLLEIIASSEAEFIALVDGDDYWTDSLKLEKQIAFMVANPDCSLSYHNVDVVYQDGRKTHKKNSPHQPRFSTIHDLFIRDFIATCSVVYRARALEGIPDWYHESDAGDWNLHLLAARNGPIGYLPDAMAAYRVHGGGTWSRMTAVEQWQFSVGVLSDMRKRFDAMYHSDIDRGLENVYQYLAHALAALGSSEEAFSAVRNAQRLRSGQPKAPPNLVDAVVTQWPMDGTKEGLCLRLHCQSALPTSFVCIEGQCVETHFQGSEVLIALIPHRLVTGSSRKELFVMDSRGASNSLDFPSMVQ